MQARIAVLALLAGCPAPGGYTTPPSPPQCTGGAKLVNNSCYCAAGMTWNGLQCQGTPQAGTCGGNSYPFGPDGFAQCFCLDGYKLDNAQCIELSCSGGSVASGDQCVCPDGTQWDGSQCVAVQQQLTCNGGAVPSGDQCVCPDGTQWDGAQCVAVPQQRRTCRSVLLDKGYGPSTMSSCDGLPQRCTIALLDKGYGPSAFASCRGADPACTVALLDKGYGPSAFASCEHVNAGCAIDLLNRGYGPSAFDNCKRR